jgi:hypothetical protein
MLLWHHNPLIFVKFCRCYHCACPKTSGKADMQTQLMLLGARAGMGIQGVIAERLRGRRGGIRGEREFGGT